MAQNLVELSPDQLRFTCDEAEFTFTSTAEVPPLARVVGQDRAVHAISFGISIPCEGYNIYVMGPCGTGRTFVVLEFLQRRARGMPRPNDWCYVQNFSDPDKPHYLKLPAGKGAEFRKDMEQLIVTLKQEIPRVLESEDYDNERNRIIQEIHRKRNAEFNRLEEKAQERSFTIQRGPMGFHLIPIVDGSPISPEQYSQLPDKQRRAIEERGEELKAEINQVMRAMQSIEKEGRRQLEELERNAAMSAIGINIEELKEKYVDNETIICYLRDMQKDIVENISAFRGSEEPRPGATPEAIGTAQQQRIALDRYKINVIVDHSKVEGAPVVIEYNPTYQNMIGRVERQVQFGALVTNFMMIKAGALHRANGGYLVVHAYHLLRQPFAYEVLKQALRTREIRIMDLWQEYSLISTVSLEPEPIPLDVKVVVIGNPIYYYLLQAYDEEFGELFKVQADFDTIMERTPETIRSYVQFLRTQCESEGLLHFAPSGVARLVEYGAELAEDQEKLSTRFSDICDLNREASFYASQNGNEIVTRDDVQRAIDERAYRANRIEKRIQELIEKRQIFISVIGEVVGQVNGLSYVSLGNYAFGKPSRITARTYMGTDGVINIEREVRLSGPIHNKGIMTLAGYLNGKYGQESPISMSAQISFEQLYEGVEGDSASSTELYALLSSLSDFPIKQGIAVTGSVNQHGEVQPIGGVTEKITGFYEVCKAFGLTGDQGVLIPQSNIKNLMLKAEIVEAVREGKFHLYPVETIDQGVEILTGKPAGELRTDGTYPEGTVNGAVKRRLEEFAETLEAFRSRREEESRKAEEEEDSQPPQPIPRQEEAFFLEPLDL